MASILFLIIVGTLIALRGYDIRKNNRYFRMTKETHGGFFDTVVWTYYVVGCLIVMAGILEIVKKL